jgi:hypothetical protein
VAIMSARPRVRLSSAMSLIVRDNGRRCQAGETK